MSTGEGRAGWLAEAFVAQCLHWSEGAAEENRALLGDCARQLMQAVQEGHVCLPLPEGLPTDAPARLAATGVVDTLSGETPGRPLVWDAQRLYLARHHRDECVLAEAVRTRAAAGRLCVLSGGPGTGKTSSIARLLGRWLTQRPDLRIALAAPTGKAAARMMEALQARLPDLPLAVQTALPRSASTVHRLLGIHPNRALPYHGPSRPLNLDVLIVDEASMLDQALAVHLLQALPAEAVLVLLGDKDQLAAVEAGAVFAELSAHSHHQPSSVQAVDACLDQVLNLGGGPQATLPGLSALADAVIWLQTSYRFAADSPLGQLAGAVRSGNRAACHAVLPACADASGLVKTAVGWWDNPDPAGLYAVLAQGYAGYWQAVQAGLMAPSVAGLFEALGRFRVLAAVHAGPRGVRALNQQLTAGLAQHLGLAQQPGVPLPGWPVLVLENDPASALFNGDVGIVLPGHPGWLVWFPDGRGGYRALPWNSLPRHEAAWAMTVHKSQGSEFDQVALVLPDTSTPVLTRELLYTGVTRARSGVWLIGEAVRLDEAVSRPTQRDSGLAARLAGA